MGRRPILRLFGKVMKNQIIPKAFQINKLNIDDLDSFKAISYLVGQYTEMVSSVFEVGLPILLPFKSNRETIQGMQITTDLVRERARAHLPQDLLKRIPWGPPLMETMKSACLSLIASFVLQGRKGDMAEEASLLKLIQTVMGIALQRKLLEQHILEGVKLSNELLLYDAPLLPLIEGDLYFGNEFARIQEVAKERGVEVSSLGDLNQRAILEAAHIRMPAHRRPKELERLFQETSLLYFFYDYPF